MYKQIGKKLKSQLNKNIVALATLKSKEVIDYLLLIPKQPLNFLKSGEKLMIVLEEEPADYNKPSLSDFMFIKCLGQGGSASVFLVRHKSNGKIYALKQIEKSYFVEFKRMEQVLR